MNKIAPQSQAFAIKVHSIFKRRNNDSSTGVPGSHNPDRLYRSMRLLSTVSLSILLLLSIPTLALKAYSYNFIESNVEMGFYLVNENGMTAPGEMLVAALPLNLFRVPEKLVLVVAMLNVLLSMAHLTFVAWDWKAGRRVSSPKLSARGLSSQLHRHKHALSAATPWYYIASTPY